MYLGMHGAHASTMTNEQHMMSEENTSKGRTMKVLIVKGLCRVPIVSWQSDHRGLFYGNALFMLQSCIPAPHCEPKLKWTIFPLLAFCRPSPPLPPLSPSPGFRCSHQPIREWLQGIVRQPSGLCATQDSAWYHQHLQEVRTMTRTGGECGQIGGNRKQNAFRLPMQGSRTHCSGAGAGNGWPLGLRRYTLFYRQSM